MSISSMEREISRCEAEIKKNNEEIKKLEKRNEELQRKSEIDALTGLNNRYSLNEYSEIALQRAIIIWDKNLMRDKFISFPKWETRISVKSLLLSETLVCIL